MQKMKYDLYNRIMADTSLSRLELHLLFWLAKHQDENGYITGVYYQEIVECLSCSKSGFYLVRDSLAEKGYISWDKSHNADMDIKLYDNSFCINGDIVYENYVDLNISMFESGEFYKCRAGAIKLAMYMVKRVAAAKAITYANSYSADSMEAENSRKLWFNPRKFLSVVKDILKVEIRSIKEYLGELKLWIGSERVQSNANEYTVITVLKKGLKSPDNENKSYPERKSYIHKIKSYCRRNGIETDRKNLRDTADLI
ncbi:MAG: hypothetical protein K2M60_02220, partial [Lachnospiraceae bacterium]|nr:hypothetical protein [Lachnospiraceae bacterium]